MRMALTSESSLLALIDQYFPNTGKNFSLARGDDCSAHESRLPIATSADLFLEDTHFRRSYFTASDTGYKALAVNLSDLAACGARPVSFVLSLGLPPDLEESWIEEFFSGMGELARTHELFLSGGDICASEKIIVAITIMGELANMPLRRGVASPGDSVFLVGKPGLARTGLVEFERSGRQRCLSDWPHAANAHLRPVPLVEAGLRLAEAAASGISIGLMDVSDGIARDLPRLLGPESGADLTLREQDLPAEVVAYAKKLGLSPLLFALEGGEDYILLGTCPAHELCSLKRLVPGLWKLGSVRATSGITCNGQIVGRGFDHFERNRQD